MTSKTSEPVERYVYKSQKATYLKKRSTTTTTTNVIARDHSWPTDHYMTYEKGTESHLHHAHHQHSPRHYDSHIRDHTHPRCRRRYSSAPDLCCLSTQCDPAFCGKCGRAPKAFRRMLMRVPFAKKTSRNTSGNPRL